jgi:hypothetical protein
MEDKFSYSIAYEQTYDDGRSEMVVIARFSHFDYAIDFVRTLSVYLARKVEIREDDKIIYYQEFR